MPTLTRLAACLLFGALTFPVGLRYLALYEEPPETFAGGVFLAAVAAFIGWSFVGPRITPSLIRSVSMVLQGYIATLGLALFLFAFYDAFGKGFQMVYRDLGDVFDGTFRMASEHITRMMDGDFLIFLGTVILGIGITLCIVFRLAEARRLAK